MHECMYTGLRNDKWLLIEWPVGHVRKLGCDSNDRKDRVNNQ